MTATDLHQRMLNLLDRAKAMSTAPRAPQGPFAAEASASSELPAPPRHPAQAPLPMDPPAHYGAAAAMLPSGDEPHIPDVIPNYPAAEPEGDLVAEVSGRGEARQKVLRRGKITYQNFEIECQVRDISSTGAKLRLAGDVTVPSSFKLLILPEKITKMVQVCWRDELLLGVRFMDD